MKTQSQNELMTCNVKKMGLQSIVATGLLITAMSANAAVVYNNDFSSSVAEYTSGSGWTLGSGVYNNTLGANVASPAMTSVAAAGQSSGEDFVMTSSFTISSYTAGGGDGGTLGFAALSDSSTLADDYLLADVNPNLNVFRLHSFNGAGLLSSATYTPGISTTTEYTLTLTGNYSGADLGLTLDLFDGTTTESITGTLTSTDLASMGDFFGFRDRTTSSGALNVDYNFLNLETTGAVPEPSSTALLLLGTGLLLAGRKRKSMQTLNHV